MKLCPALRELLERGDLALFMAPVVHPTVITTTMDFYHPPRSSDPYGAKYTLKLSDRSPTHRGFPEVVCLFPNHPNHKKQFLQVRQFSRRLSTLNEELNRRLRKSMDNTAIGNNTKLVVLFGNCIYRCEGIVGTMYLICASHVAKKNSGNVANQISTDQPILANFNGQGKPKSFFMVRNTLESTHSVMHNLLPLSKGNPILVFGNEPVFVCEREPGKTDEDDELRIHTISQLDAIAMVTDLTKNPSSWLQHETNVFSSSESLPAVEEEEDYSWTAQQADPEEEVLTSSAETTPRLVAEPAIPSTTNRPRITLPIGIMGKPPDPFDDQ